MRKLIMAVACVCVAVSSCSTKTEVAILPAEDFTKNIDGKQVSLYTLKNGDLTMQVTNFGARVVSLGSRGKDGDM